MAGSTASSIHPPTLSKYTSTPAHSHQRQLGELHVELARLRLGQDRHHVAGLDGAQAEDLGGAFHPRAFEVVAQHPVSHAPANASCNLSYQGWCGSFNARWVSK